MTGQLHGRRWFTVAEFCSITGIAPSSVRQWLREGKLRGRDLNAGTGRRSRWRVLASEARRFERR